MLRDWYGISWYVSEIKMWVWLAPLVRPREGSYQSISKAPNFDLIVYFLGIHAQIKANNGEVYKKGIYNFAD